MNSSTLNQTGELKAIMCLTPRSGEDMRPRKYFCATMLVAVCDQTFGNSTLRSGNLGVVEVHPFPIVTRREGDPEMPAPPANAPVSLGELLMSQEGYRELSLLAEAHDRDLAGEIAHVLTEYVESNKQEL